MPSCSCFAQPSIMCSIGSQIAKWVHKKFHPLRRFMRDLPPGLTTFNDACLAQQRAQPRQPAMAANREHVRAIVAEAQRPAPGLLAYAGGRPCAWPRVPRLGLGMCSLGVERNGATPCA